MEKKLLLAAALSLAVLLLWEKLVPKPAPPPVQPTPVAAAAPTSPAEAVPAIPQPAAALPEPASASGEVATTLDNGLVRATFSNRGAVMTSLLLLKHTDEKKRPLELIRALPPLAPKPLALEFESDPALTKRQGEAFFVVERVSDRQARFVYADKAVAITKDVRLAGGYLFDVKVSVTGPPYVLYAASGLLNPTAEEQASRYVMSASAVVSTGGSLAHARAEKIEKPVSWPLDPRGFAGVEDNYFLAALVPRKPGAARVEAVPLAPVAGKPSATVAVGVSGQGSLDAAAYYGPKDVEILESLNLGLEKTVDFGWYGILARPLLWLLKRAYGWAGNWGAAILLVTLAIRILLFPLMHKSYASMKKMQKLAPKMNAIRDKYKKAKTDAAQRQKMNQELMALYQAEGYNPMSGCFPVLLQLPILVAFYNVLSRAIELRHAPFVFWIKDLSAVDRSYILLILMIVTMYVQQAMTPSTADPTQKKIFMAMPLLWGFFLKDMPSGLVLYWLFSNVLTILQQMLINRMGKAEEAPAEKPARIKKAKA